MTDKKYDFLAKSFSLMMLFIFIFFVYKHNNEINNQINSKVLSYADENIKSPEKEIEESSKKDLKSPFLNEEIGKEIVSTRWFSESHKGIDYALIEEIDYGTQVKLKAISSGTLYYWIWKAPEDEKFINWTRKEYGGWGKFAIIESDDWKIYVYWHLEEFNKDLFNPTSDNLQKVVSKLMFAHNIWKKTIWFSYDRDVTIYKGVKINEGDYIGDMWNTGMSYGYDRKDDKKTGKHLHFQIYEKGNIIEVCENKVCDKVYKSWNPEKFWINSFYNEYEATKKYLESKNK